MDTYFKVSEIRKISNRNFFAKFHIFVPKTLGIPTGNLLRTLFLSDFPTFGIQTLFFNYFEFSRLSLFEETVQNFVESFRNIVLKTPIKKDFNLKKDKKLKYSKNLLTNLNFILFTQRIKKEKKLLKYIYFRKQNVSKEKDVFFSLIPLSVSESYIKNNYPFRETSYTPSLCLKYNEKFFFFKKRCITFFQASLSVYSVNRRRDNCFFQKIEGNLYSLSYFKTQYYKKRFFYNNKVVRTNLLNFRNKGNSSLIYGPNTPRETEFYKRSELEDLLKSKSRHASPVSNSLSKKTLYQKKPLPKKKKPNKNLIFLGKNLVSLKSFNIHDKRKFYNKSHFKNFGYLNIKENKKLFSKDLYLPDSILVVDQYQFIGQSTELRVPQFKLWFYFGFKDEYTDHFNNTLSSHNIFEFKKADLSYFKQSPEDINFFLKSNLKKKKRNPIRLQKKYNKSLTSLCFHNSVPRSFASKDKSPLQENSVFKDGINIYEIDLNPIPSPIRKINFSVQNYSTDIEVLTFELYTNGSVSPIKAFEMTRKKALNTSQFLARNPSLQSL
uniref:Plastid-encoded RNA polymerase subunit alpha n=1 Tax=Microrhizoidea pickettheapsiorum TaxID=2604950 RepID=A0A5B9RFP7_9CHLO|nr:RNA polymerase a-subunit [Microrhizoidea pickettheapsiorum]QEG77678.1 RNA polymerase a-subunit [Microrhizoidea pickettheapsiorum]